MMPALRIWHALPALYLAFGVVAQADSYSINGYTLGMTLEQFIAQPIPGATGADGTVMKCFDEPDLRWRVSGVTQVDYNRELRIGAKTCTFLKPDLLMGAGHWTYSSSLFLDRATQWDFTFLRDQPQGGAYRLFRIAAQYKPAWEHRSDPIDDVRAKLQQLLGPGQNPNRKLVNVAVGSGGGPLVVADNAVYDELIWSSGDQTVEFFEAPASATQPTPFYCVGLVNESMMVEYNKRMAPSGPKLWAVCQPDPPRDPSHSP